MGRQVIEGSSWPADPDPKSVKYAAGLLENEGCNSTMTM